MASQSLGGSSAPLVAFRTFFTLSVTPDVVTLSGGQVAAKHSGWGRGSPGTLRLTLTLLCDCATALFSMLQ